MRRLDLEDHVQYAWMEFTHGHYFLRHYSNKNPWGWARVDKAWDRDDQLEWHEWPIFSANHVIGIESMMVSPGLGRECVGDWAVCSLKEGWFHVNVRNYNMVHYSEDHSGTKRQIHLTDDKYLKPLILTGRNLSEFPDTKALIDAWS